MGNQAGRRGLCWAPLWWAALCVALVGLILAPLRTGAFIELLAAAGVAFGGLRALGPRIRHWPDLRWFAALATAVAVAATATSLIWATPAAAGLLH